SLNDPTSALEFATKAATVNPQSADLQTAIGLASLNLGRFDEAETHLRESLRLDPGNAPAWWQLSRLRRPDSDAHFVDELRQAVERANGPRATALVEFALHRELDRLGDYADAALALERACSTMRKTVTYAADESDRLFAALRALPMDGADGGTAGTIDMPFTPVFIVGMHRSGTTLLEQLLAGHDDVRAGGELYDFTSQL